jgi:hypothetical protein
MSIQNNNIANELTKITGITWRLSDDGHTYQMAPIDMHKVLVLYTTFQNMGVAHTGETDPNGYIIAKLKPEQATKFISNPEQTADLADELKNAGRLGRGI